MIRGLFLKCSRSYTDMQNVIFHVKLVVPDLKLTSKALEADLIIKITKVRFQ